MLRTLCLRRCLNPRLDLTGLLCWLQGYAADFLPWLLPLHAKHLSQLAAWSHEIRDFMTDGIIQQRLDSWDQASNPDKDYVDELIGHVRGNAQPAMTWDTAMFALEDIVGGHSAVGNLLVKVSDKRQMTVGYELKRGCLIGIPLSSQ